MSKAPRLLIGTCVLLSYLAAGTTALAQRVDIVVIYQNFIASWVAADECHALDKTLALRFQSNLLAVTIRAAQAFKQRNPSLSDHQVAAMMQTLSKEIAQAVNSTVERNGCNNSKVRQLLKLYRIHGTMTLP